MGNANKSLGMIDISDKEKTLRIAKASAFVRMDAQLVEMVKKNEAPKGNIIETARVAGIMAAKKTEELIPLCHNIAIDKVGLSFDFKKEGIRIDAIAKTTAKTGVEMEAMMAVSIAALTVYDMLKMFNKEICIEGVRLLEKSGGKDGDYKRN